MTTLIPFEKAGRLPAPGDNVAIATRRLERGAKVERDGDVLTLPHTIMEGHRFVLEPIAAGQSLLSWGLPFGKATRALEPGEYVCNEKILRVLAERNIDFKLPKEANFSDHMARYVLDEDNFTAGVQVPSAAEPIMFEGLRRPGSRGVGTRNFVVLLATTSQSAAFAHTLEERFADARKRFPNVDGVVAVTHTEGGGDQRPNNIDFVLRALAGFMVHPNVAAVLAIDYADGAYSNRDLQSFMHDGGYALSDVAHEFFTIDADFESELQRASSIVEQWLPQADACERAPQSSGEIKVALQCGGSDAFSGISGNALAGWVAKAIIAQGGAANLAETDELIGAEPYVLSNVKDVATARAFLEKIEAFKERVGNHGSSAEGNPSGGNNFRGLYNIALKSIGAARKRDPDVRLDAVIDYAAPMREPGYYFMDSPGNDLESIAGQVASGANLIFFITGNGSITNFPFVPTLKFVTTTGRFELLAHEMDVNAGRYNDGLDMDELGKETLGLALDIASGQRSKGELAGHAQVSLWRNWRQTDASKLSILQSAAKPDGVPLEAREAKPANMQIAALRTEDGRTACDQVALVMPTSLCSGQVARLIADHLNAEQGGQSAVSKFVSLVHTEGCGAANADDLYMQTLLGHLRHPFIKRAVLLEHGCEKTHNDAVRHYLAEHGVPLNRFGWASVQLDGGIDKVRKKVSDWFVQTLADQSLGERVPMDTSGLRLGVTSHGPLDDAATNALISLVLRVVNAGATVVIPENASFVAEPSLRNALLAKPDAWNTTLAYGEPATTAGLHVMAAPTHDSVETLTGLGATGVEVMLTHIARAPVQTHPMVPLIQVSSNDVAKARYGRDLDATVELEQPVDAAVSALLSRITEVASGTYTPKLFGLGNQNFQLTRGLLGVSM